MRSIDKYRNIARDMKVLRQCGPFMTRGDGLMQFPVGDVVMSIGISETHYGPGDGSAVEIAVLTRDDTGRGAFLTQKVMSECGLEDPGDQVAVVTPEELTVILRHLSKE